MYYIILSGIFISIIIFIILRNKYINKKRKKEIELAEKCRAEQKDLEERIATNKQTLEQYMAEIPQLAADRATEQAKYEQQKHDLEQSVALLNQQKEMLAARQKDLIEHSEIIVDATVHNHFEQLKNEYEYSTRSTLDELKQVMNQEFTEELEKFTTSLDKVKEELNEYQAKRDAVNADILRQRALEEKQDFYRVCLSALDIDDIQILNSIRSRLHKHDGLDKLIYDFYVSKPVQEMTKRVLEGRAPCGIYKITRLKTGEIYIGKSTDVKARWQQHAKTVFGCGTIAHSILHTTMEKDGIENFTFELLEEVPKDELTNREKYWITFYNSKKYGLNEREG